MLTDPLPEKTYIWKLDFDRDVGMLDFLESKIEKVEIPLRPFLGTIGVAPNFGEAVISLTQVGRTRIGNVVDPKYTVVAKFPKKYLPSRE